MKIAILSFLFLTTSALTLAQFAGPVGTPGTTAMHKDSSAFVNWANNAQLDLGLIDISNPFSGLASSGDAISPTGIPDGACDCSGNTPDVQGVPERGQYGWAGQEPSQVDKPEREGLI